jgi:hypothetical protein
VDRDDHEATLARTTREINQLIDDSADLNDFEGIRYRLMLADARDHVKTAASQLTRLTS